MSDIRLTKKGKEAVAFYIRELEAKRKEILDAKKDTADDTPIPTEEDIVSDIEWSEDEDGSYFNVWGVTDHINADMPIFLVRGKDYAGA